MKYFSMSSSREKEYLIEPYRLIYSPGGHVPAGVRARVQGAPHLLGRSHPRHLAARRSASRRPRCSDAAFAHSIGVNEGTPEHIEIAFEPRIAPYVRERQWHASQKNTDRKDGGVVLSLDVCNDWALRSWILSLRPARPRAEARRRWPRRSKTRSTAPAALRGGVEQHGLYG